MDTLSTGRVFRCLAVIDEFSRECLALHVAHSIPAASVIEVLERLREERGLPERVICDNGSEFTSRAFDAWAYSRGLKIEYIQPGKPMVIVYFLHNPHSYALVAQQYAGP